MNGKEILKFWFDEIDSSVWWKKDFEFDALICERFRATHAKAKIGELFAWRDSAEGRLAEIIVLDQFSRNIFRDHSDAFAQDSLALILAQEAIREGKTKDIEKRMLPFLYMPFMHSESKVIHEQAVRYFSGLESKNSLSFEMKHKAIIDRFGRYPHRNKILGRVSTPEEIEFLKGPGSSF